MHPEHEPGGRTALAILGGFLQPDPKSAHGGNKAAFLSSYGVAKSRCYETVHSFQDPRVLAQGRGPFDIPQGASVVFRRKRELIASIGVFDAVLAPETEWEQGAPHALRPFDDWSPVVCEIGTSHSGPQWLHLFSALASGQVRSSDALVFKANVTRRLFTSVIDEWSRRFGPLPSCQHFVIPQGIRCDQQRRNDQARQSVRSQLAIGDDKVAFLAFSRLSPGTKGDQLASMVLWRDIVRVCPEAVLIQAGATVDRHFAEDLRRVARELGIGNSVIVLHDPHELWPDPGPALMSAADVMLHLSTGVEEVASLVVCEAMAHGLPIIAADWSGLSELIGGEDVGTLVPTSAVMVPDDLRLTNSMGPDPAYNVELARCAVIDFSTARTAILTLARSAERRMAMGQAARRRAEQVLDVDVVNDQRLHILRGCSQMSRRAWRGVPEWTVRPLVDVNRVVATLASSHARPDANIAVSCVENMAFMPEWQSPPVRALLSFLVETARSQGTVKILDLIAAANRRLEEMSGGNVHGAALDEQSIASYMRLCARLIAFDVLVYEPQRNCVNGA
jgi:glycosyltransferase involved in cell wall biosynthesis